MENSIHYVLILDQSGSMGMLKREVISSFNEQLEMIRILQEKDRKYQFKITLCRFNDTIDYRFVGEPVKHIEKLNDSDYNPESCTALYDAIGRSFSITEELIKPGDKVFFAIFTDGLENASTKFRATDIKKILQSAEEKKWEVKFFCRYEDDHLYRKELDIDKNMAPLTMDDDGLSYMAKEVHFCMCYLADDGNVDDKN